MKKVNVPLVILSLIFSMIAWIVGEFLLSIIGKWPYILQMAIWGGQFFIWLIIAFYLSQLFFDGGYVTDFIKDYTATYWKYSLIFLGIIIIIAMLLQFLYMIVHVNEDRSIFNKPIRSPATVLLLDASQHMGNSDPNKDSIKSMTDFISNQDPSERLGVAIMNDDSIKWLLEIGIADSKDRVELSSDLDNLSFSGDADIQTLLLDGIDHIQKNINRCVGDRIIIFSDGDDVNNVNGVNVDLVVQKAKEADKGMYDDIPISTMGWYNPNELLENKSVGILIVSDISGSMSSSDPQYKSVSAIKDMVLNRDDFPLGIMLFNDDTTLINSYSNISSNPERIMESLNKVNFSGGTDIQGALEDAFSEIRSFQDNPDRNIIVLFSDGEASVDIGEIAEISRNMSINVNDDIPVYTAGYYPDSWTLGSSGEELLRDISAATGGLYNSIYSVSSFENIYNDAYKLESMHDEGRLLMTIALATGGLYNSTDLVPQYTSANTQGLQSTSYGSLLFDWPHLLKLRSPMISGLWAALHHILLAALFGSAIGLAMAIIVDDKRIIKGWIALQAVKSIIGATILELGLQAKFFPEPLARCLYAVCIGTIVIPYFMNEYADITNLNNYDENASLGAFQSNIVKDSKEPKKDEYYKIDN